MKATRYIVVLISMMMVVNAHAAFLPVVLDTHLTCHFAAVTKSALPVGELHNFGDVSFNFESRKTVFVDSNFGANEFIFGFGKAELNQTVRSWDANKNEILTPFHIVIDVGIDEKSLRKTMKSAITMKNPFTNELETQNVFMSTFSVSDSFIYTQATYRGKTTPALGDFSHLMIHCEFGTAD